MFKKEGKYFEKNKRAVQSHSSNTFSWLFLIKYIHLAPLEDYLGFVRFVSLIRVF